MSDLVTPPPVQLDGGIHLLDLMFQGKAGVIAAYLLADGDDVALVETGPSSCLPSLEEGMRACGFGVEDLTHIFLTHIHLDHAGAAGPIMRRAERAKVYVHPFGAPHVIDPTKLVNSATRIYGDRMESLWGEFAPIPAGRVVAVDNNQEFNVAGRTLVACHTPGHAHHHIAWHDPRNATVFTGDVAGIRLPGSDYVCPPTPPPDLDYDLWKASIATLRTLDARSLCLTHFGPSSPPAGHLDQLERNLAGFFALGEKLTAEGVDQVALTSALHGRLAAQVGENSPILDELELATPSYMAAMGLNRYWTKRREAGA